MNSARHDNLWECGRRGIVIAIRDTGRIVFWIELTGETALAEPITVEIFTDYV